LSIGKHELAKGEAAERARDVPLNFFGEAAAASLAEVGGIASWMVGCSEVIHLEGVGKRFRG